MAKGDPNEPVTRGMLVEAIAAILTGMDNLYERFKGEVNSLRSDINVHLKNTDAKIDQMKNELKDEIDDLEAELSDTPSRREFE